MLVVSQRAAQQAQVVEGQDEDDHAAQGDAAHPPAGRTQSAGLYDLGIMIMYLYRCLLYIYGHALISLPVEVQLVNFRVVVLNLGVGVADEDGEVGQAALHRERLGEAADVGADAVNQTLNI